MDPTTTAIGTWSGGRYMRFGEPLDDARLQALLRPGEGIDTVITADTYGAGEADSLLGRTLAGRRSRRLLPDRRDRPRLLYRRARWREGIPPLHRPAPARAERVRRLHRDGHRTQPRALRGGSVRPAAAAQPRPHRLHQRSRLAGHGGRARGRADAPTGGRARSRERVHARSDRLHRALRGADRLGDDHPQPAGAVAGRAGAERRSGQ